MYQNISLHDFHEAFKSSGYEDNFTVEAREALYSYFCDWEVAADQQVELDVISICCEFSEYSSLDEYVNDTGNEVDIEELRQETTVLELTGGRIVVRDY